MAWSVEWFVYCRDRPGSAQLRAQLTEAHWSYMDGFADAMIARGPTLTEDGQAATGSLHIVDLPDLDAVRAFAFEEPYYQGGVFADVLIRRWRNELGRTMWEFTGDPVANERFLVIGHGAAGAGIPDDDAEGRFLSIEPHRDRIILRGPLLAEESGDWRGTGMLVEVADRTELDRMIVDDPNAAADRYVEVQVHRWRFGGRS
jgi:uncharacterized protein YciI